MQTDTKVLNKIRNLEAYFQAGLNEATGLRKLLEGVGSSAAPHGGLNAEQVAKLTMRSEKRRTKK